MSSSPEVAGHDHDGVLEVDLAPLAVGEHALVEHLVEEVHHVGVRLLDLVEEHDAVGALAHRLGEDAALAEADVAGRRADQPRDGVRLHVLGHVDGGQEALAAEEEVGEGERGLGLADAGGADEEEDPLRRRGVAEPGALRAQTLGDGAEAVVLAHHPRRQGAFQLEGEPRLVAHHLAGRDAGPVGDHGRHHVGSDVQGDQRLLALDLGEGREGLGQPLGIGLTLVLFVRLCRPCRPFRPCFHSAPPAPRPRPSARSPTGPAGFRGRRGAPRSRR